MPLNCVIPIIVGFVVNAFVPLFFQEIIDSGTKNLHFVRVHAPWKLLCKYAEELNLRAPIQVS